MKYLFIFLLLSFSAKAQFGIVASSYYIEPRVSRFLDDRAITGLGTTVSYRFTLTKLVNNLKGYSNASFSTADALSGRLDTCLYSLFPLIGGNSTKANGDFIETYSGTGYSAFSFTGSPTFTNLGFNTNGVNQSATLNYNGSATPANYMTTNGVSNTDTVRQTGFNYHVFLKDSAENFLAGGTTVASSRILFYQIGTSLSSYVYNSTATQGGIDFTRASTNNRGLYVQNRRGLNHEVYLNGSLATSYTNSSYNFKFPKDNTSLIYLQFNGFSNYFAGTIQYFAVAKRGFTSGEVTAYNNIIQEFINNK